MFPGADTMIARTLATVMLLCGAAYARTPGEPPEEYRLAERAMRLLLKDLGVPTDAVEIVYRKLGKGVQSWTSLGHSAAEYDGRPIIAEHQGRRIVINLNEVKDPSTLLHEFWHVKQRIGEGLNQDAYNRAYNRFSYNANPYETEAYLIQKELYALYQKRLGQTAWPEKRMPWSKETPMDKWVREAGRKLQELSPRMLEAWRGNVPPATLRRLQMLAAGGRFAGVDPETTNPSRGQWQRGRIRTLGSKIKGEARGAAAYAFGFLIKEGIKAAYTRDPERMKEAAQSVATKEFLAGWAGFTGIAYGVGKVMDQAKVKGLLEKAIPKAAPRLAARMWLPAVAAIPAMEYAFGERDPAKIARTTAIYGTLAAVTDLPVLLGMIAVPGPGTLFGIAYFSVKLGLMLWAGESIEEYIDHRSGPLRDLEEGFRKLFEARRTGTLPPRSGMKSGQTVRMQRQWE